MGFQLKFVCALILMSVVSTKCDDLDEEPVGMMTTLEPIDSADYLDSSADFAAISTSSGPVNCSAYSCDMCVQNNCSWVTCFDVIDSFPQCSNDVGVNCTLSSCEHDDCKNVTDCEECGKTDGCDWVQCNESDTGPYCGKPAEFCPPIACNATTPTTIAPNDTTTTSSPDTTTTLPDTTTTPPDTTTTPPDTTTTPPDTTTTPTPDTTTTPTPDTTTTPAPDTTTSPSPDTTTSPPSPDTTTEPPTTPMPFTTTPGPAPQSGGFSAGSFFGGITLTLALIGVGLGGYKFYKTRYDVNYRTL